MKLTKTFRIGIIVNFEYSDPLKNVMSLAFGKENVIASESPHDIFGILRTHKPHLLIIAPDLFERNRIRPEDICALRDRMHYKIAALYSTEKSLETRERFQALAPDREYILPKEYLTLTREIPALCTNPYEKRKKPLSDKTKDNLNRIFEECGFRTTLKGAPLLKDCLLAMYFDPSLHRWGGATKLYNTLAKKYGTTPRIAARSMLRFLETSWNPKTEELLRKELNIPDFYTFVPINFGRFTELFNTYYTIKYGDPGILLKPKPRKKKRKPKE